MHIKDIVNYVKNEINFSREFCEDNVFVTLRIEPIERIIENLEQKDKDNLSYAEDLVKAEAKANKYDSLVEKIKDIKEEVYTDEGIGFELDYGEKPGAIRMLNKIQELLDTKK